MRIIRSSFDMKTMLISKKIRSNNTIELLTDFRNKRVHNYIKVDAGNHIFRNKRTFLTRQNQLKIIKPFVKTLKVVRVERAFYVEGFGKG